MLRAIRVQSSWGDAYQLVFMCSAGKISGDVRSDLREDFVPVHRESRTVSVNMLRLHRDSPYDQDNARALNGDAAAKDTGPG